MPRAGSVTVARVPASSSRRRPRCRIADCTLDLDSPVLVAIVCRLTETRSRRARDDVRATYRQLRQRGVEFLGEPKDEPWGTFVMLKDPDGNQFVIGSA